MSGDFFYQIPLTDCNIISYKFKPIEIIITWTIYDRSFDISLQSCFCTLSSRFLFFGTKHQKPKVHITKIALPIFRNKLVSLSFVLLEICSVVTTTFSLPHFVQTISILQTCLKLTLISQDFKISSIIILIRNYVKSFRCYNSEKEFY